MEKFSQYRDKGSGVAPFIPTHTPVSILSTLFHVFLFSFRLPFFIAYIVSYFLVLQFLPLPVAFRKLLLWGIMGIPGLWWVDLQMDGVRRGTLADQPPERIPHGGSVIAANFTSPIDAVYLAAVFDPVFTASFPGTRQVQHISLFRAILLALSPVRLAPPQGAKLTDVATLLKKYPDRVIAVFPECTTTNGKGIMPISPSILSAPSSASIFPVCLRYTPPDVTTPVPGAHVRFLFDLLSRPTICIRVRIADAITNTARGKSSRAGDENGSTTSGADIARRTAPPDAEEERVLDKIGEALARLGRSKRVGLTLKDKIAFVEAWRRK